MNHQQESEPPDLRLMVFALIILLADVDDELERGGVVLLDTRLRLKALRAVLERFKEANL